MCKIKQLSVFFLLSFLFINCIKAQDLLWKVGFNGFFDNHEYIHNPWGSSITMFGSRAFSEVGIAIDNENEFNVGGNYLREFGSKTSTDFVDPILYYHHRSDYSEIYMGAFPKNKLIEMPNVLLNDTIQYYRPNIEGLYINLSNSWGAQTAWFDWISKQTLTDREIFVVGLTGKIRNPLIIAQYDLLIHHYANTATPGPNEVIDNGGLVARFGVNLSSLTALDSLCMSTGFAGSYNREREFSDFLHFYYGSLSELYIQFKQFGLRSTLYVGDGLNLMLGNQLYGSSFYNRNDVIWTFINKGRVNGFIEASFHILENNIIDYSQIFGISIDISGKKKLSNKASQN